MAKTPPLNCTDREQIARLRGVRYTVPQIAELLQLRYDYVAKFVRTLPDEIARREWLALSPEEKLRRRAAARRADLEANYWPEVERREAERWRTLEREAQNAA